MKDEKTSIVEDAFRNEEVQSNDFIEDENDIAENEDEDQLYEMEDDDQGLFLIYSSLNK